MYIYVHYTTQNIKLFQYCTCWGLVRAVKNTENYVYPIN